MSWQDFLAQHPVGDVIEGVVTKQVPFGSFVESEGFTVTWSGFLDSWNRVRAYLRTTLGLR